jgi:hypothetical protein
VQALRGYSAFAERAFEQLDPARPDQQTSTRTRTGSVGLVGGTAIEAAARIAGAAGFGPFAKRRKKKSGKDEL